MVTNRQLLWKKGIFLKILGSIVSIKTALHKDICFTTSFKWEVACDGKIIDRWGVNVLTFYYTLFRY